MAWWCSSGTKAIGIVIGWAVIAISAIDGIGIGSGHGTIVLGIVGCWGVIGGIGDGRGGGGDGGVVVILIQKERAGTWW